MLARGGREERATGFLCSDRSCPAGLWQEGRLQRWRHWPYWEELCVRSARTLVLRRPRQEVRAWGLLWAGGPGSPGEDLGGR